MISQKTDIKNKFLFKKHNLTKNLIKFDFLIIEQKHSSIKNSNHINFYSKINKRKFVFSLNPRYTIYELKQFIRTILFLKHSKKELLNIVLDNENLVLFFHNLLQIKKNNILLTSNQNFDKKLNLKKIQSLLYINKEALFTKSFYRQLIANHIFLITKINLNQKKNNFGLYHIFNNFSNYKKITFIASFLNIIFEDFKTLSDNKRFRYISKHKL